LLSIHGSCDSAVNSVECWVIGNDELVQRDWTKPRKPQNRYLTSGPPKCGAWMLYTRPWCPALESIFIIIITIIFINAISFFFFHWLYSPLGPWTLIYTFMIILQTVEFLGRAISSLQGCYLNIGKQTHKKKTYQTSMLCVGFQTHDPGFRASEDYSATVTDITSLYQPLINRNVGIRYWLRVRGISICSIKARKYQVDSILGWRRIVRYIVTKVSKKSASYSDNRDSRFVQNLCNDLPAYMASHLTRQ
jgi:hypothetical protein